MKHEKQRWKQNKCSIRNGGGRDKRKMKHEKWNGGGGNKRNEAQEMALEVQKKKKRGKVNQGRWNSQTVELEGEVE